MTNFNFTNKDYELLRRLLKKSRDQSYSISERKRALLDFDYIFATRKIKKDHFTGKIAHSQQHKVLRYLLNKTKDQSYSVQERKEVLTIVRRIIENENLK